MSSEKTDWGTGPVYLLRKIEVLPDKAYTNLTPDLRICRIVNGLWQVSGAHGQIDQAQAIPDMLNYHHAGFTTWDAADHYGPAEDFIRYFREQLREKAQFSTQTPSLAFTKWVPRPGRISRSIVEEAVDRSRRRMGVQTLDMLQFHWWEYRDRGYMDALRHLTDLREEGKIRHLALTNFDTEHLEEITAAGIQIVSNQIQFSLIDRRPLVKMAPFCLKHNIRLLTYGTLCGGLLDKHYVNRSEPTQSELTTASLRKYKQIIERWGGWALFQSLLRTLDAIAVKHAVSIANIAVQCILNEPAVGGVIVGTRLGISHHRTENARVFDFEVNADDLRMIESVLADSQDLMRVIGDCGDEYRR